ncbi:MAG: META domain-containing protein [Vicinamibacterales bacterium]
MIRRCVSLPSGRTVVRACLLLSVFVLGGCSSPASPTFGTVSAAGLEGVWTLEIIQRAGGPALATPRNAVYTLTFRSGTVLAQADCNTCVGTFTMVGDAVTISPALACTRAACPTSDFEVIYEALLPGESRVGVSEQTMVLNSSRGQLRFTR